MDYWGQKRGLSADYRPDYKREFDKDAQEHFPERAKRSRFSGKVRLVVACDPWSLVFTLAGINLSTSGALAFLSYSHTHSVGMTPHDVEALLTKGDSFHLQIEERGDAESIPYVKAVIQRKTLVREGIEVAFSFENQNDPDVFSLVSDIDRSYHEAAGIFL